MTISPHRRHCEKILKTQYVGAKKQTLKKEVDTLKRRLSTKCATATRSALPLVALSATNESALSWRT